MMSSVCDDEIIKRRLQIDGDGTGESRIMTKFMKSFVKWCATDESPMESQIQLDRLLAQLSNIESSSAKWSNIIQMNERELTLYNRLKCETNDGVSEATESIDKTKVSLESARQVRSNKMEYDALAKLIMEHPPRSDTANKLTLLHQELNSLKTEMSIENNKKPFAKTKRDSLEHRLNLRRKQLHALVASLHQLQQTFPEDIENDVSDMNTSTNSAMEVV